MAAPLANLEGLLVAESPLCSTDLGNFYRRRQEDASTAWSMGPYISREAETDLPFFTSVYKFSPKRKFLAGYPCGHPAKNFGQALQILEKQAFWNGHPARTSVEKLRSEKLRADFAFPILTSVSSVTVYPPGTKPIHAGKYSWGINFPRGPGDRKNSFSLERMKKKKKPFPHARNFHSRLKISFRIESLIFTILPLEIEYFQSLGPLFFFFLREYMRGLYSHSHDYRKYF